MADVAKAPATPTPSIIERTQMIAAATQARIDKIRADREAETNGPRD